MNPKISVIMSTYNGSRYIKESIESVINQDYKNIEFIIINDNSNDNVENIIDEYTKKDDRIICIKNNSNLGLTASLNLGIKKSKGKYIARIDDDDIWCSNKKLSEQVDFLETNNNYGIVGTSMYIINENGNILEKIDNRITDKEIRSHISQSNQFAHPSILIRKSSLEDVGYYNENFKVAQDLELWLRIGTKYKFYNIPKHYLKYRISSNNMSYKKYFFQKLNSFKVLFIYKKYYPNFIKGFIAKSLGLLLPRKLFKIIININKKIEKR